MTKALVMANLQLNHCNLQHIPNRIFITPLQHESTNIPLISLISSAVNVGSLDDVKPCSLLFLSTISLTRLGKLPVSENIGCMNKSIWKWRIKLSFILVSKTVGDIHISENMLLTSTSNENYINYTRNETISYRLINTNNISTFNYDI